MNLVIYGLNNRGSCKNPDMVWPNNRYFNRSFTLGSNLRKCEGASYFEFLFLLCRRELPLAHRVERALLEQWMPAQNAGLDDLPL